MCIIWYTHTLIFARLIYLHTVTDPSPVSYQIWSGLLLIIHQRLELMCRTGMLSNQDNQYPENRAECMYNGMDLLIELTAGLLTIR